MNAPENVPEVASGEVPEVVTSEDDRLVLRVAHSACSEHALQATAFELIDRSFVLIDRDDEGFTVSIAARSGATGPLESLVAAFGRSLSDHRLRERIRADNAEQIQKLQTESFGASTGTAGGSSLGDPEDFGDLDDLEDLDFLDDPLGIAVPWEEHLAESKGEGGASESESGSAEDGEPEPEGGG
jgi:His-Xaa-Ser system protein HxsD